MKSSHWRWHLDEMSVKINGERHYLRRTVDHEGEVLESFVTDELRSYAAARRDRGASDWQETGRWLNNRAENSHLPFRRRDRAMLRVRRMRRALLQNSRGEGFTSRIHAGRRAA